MSSYVPCCALQLNGSCFCFTGVFFVNEQIVDKSILHVQRRNDCLQSPENLNPMVQEWIIIVNFRGSVFTRWMWAHNSSTFGGLDILMLRLFIFSPGSRTP